MARSFSCLILLLISAFGSLHAQSLDIFFEETPGVTVVNVDSVAEYMAVYELAISQPLDHNDASKGDFTQKVFVSHKGFESPTVILTQGYEIRRNRTAEISHLFEANQINVEHRFFGDSQPDSLDYDYLNLEQATADLHRVREIMGEVYKGKWVSSGISKGGATTIIYRYFYPDDVDACVPYVAPINREFEESRIYTFLDSVGSDACRAKLEALQKRVLSERERAIPLVHFYAKGANLSFTYLNEAEAFEYAVLEFPFSFWQYGHDCASIPGDEATLEESLEYMLNISNVDFFADRSMRSLASHYYQSAAEMGYYGYETEEFEGLLEALPMQPHPHAAFTPEGMDVAFDGALLKKVNAWLETDAHGLVYIYGGVDTWSASAVPPNDKVDAVWFMLSGQHHGSARMRNMNPSEKQLLADTIKKWLNIELDLSRLD